jgi:hypothetical protein
LRATPEQLCDALGACTELNAVYRRLLKMALEELRLIDEQIGQLDLEMASLLSEHQDAVERLAEVPGLGVDSAQQIIAEVGPTAATRDLSLREMFLLVSWGLQPPLPEGQPPHAALTQSGCERRSQDQRKHLRNRVSPLRPAPGTQSSHRGHCPSTVSTDLADPAPRSSLRRTGPRRHQAVKAKAHGENDPATPKPRLSDRTTESSTQPSTRAVIFEPVAT